MKLITDISAGGRENIHLVRHLAQHLVQLETILNLLKICIHSPGASSCRISASGGMQTPLFDNECTGCASEHVRVSVYVQSMKSKNLMILL